MKENYNLTIKGDKITLVPYRTEHVEKYHEWMQDQQLQEQTASEPLTIAQEFEMQQNWQNDPKKCTFIIIDNEYLDDRDKTQGMSGDVNLFLNDYEDEHCAEIDVMVAEERSRRQGFAKEAVLLMMAYGNQVLQINKFIAKIGVKNEPSINLFRGLGFQEIQRNEVFQEIAMHLQVPETDNNDCIFLGKNLKYGSYD